MFETYDIMPRINMQYNATSKAFKAKLMSMSMKRKNGLVWGFVAQSDYNRFVMDGYNEKQAFKKSVSLNSLKPKFKRTKSLR